MMNVSRGAVGAVAHSALTGLTADDHTQYALLAGRSGGQTLLGGTASANGLTLKSTSHATKGKIIFGNAGTFAYDETTDRLGVGTTSPANDIHVERATNVAIKIRGTGVGNRGAIILAGPNGAITQIVVRDSPAAGDLEFIDSAFTAVNMIIKNLGGVTIPRGSLTLTDINVILSSATGTKFGTSTAEKFAFHNSTPVAQRASAAQAAVTVSTNSITSGGSSDVFANWTDLTTYATDAATIRNTCYQMARKILLIETLVNELRAADVEKGLIKGSA